MSCGKRDTSEGQRLREELEIPPSEARANSTSSPHARSGASPARSTGTVDWPRRGRFLPLVGKASWEMPRSP